MSTCSTNLRIPSHAYYQELVDEITSKYRIPSIDVYESDTSNACATIIPARYSDGVSRPIIAFNPRFVARLWRQSEWAVIAVFAHEVAHHYNLDLRKRKSLAFWNDPVSHKQELNADRFAGYVLRCKGASLNDSLDMYRAVPFVESRSHPNVRMRANAMRTGWNEAHCKFTPKRRVVQPSPASMNLNQALFGLAGIFLIGALIAD